MYHVICRTNPHDVIFEDDEDKHRSIKRNIKLITLQTDPEQALVKYEVLFKDICSRLDCTPERLIKMRRKTGIYKKGVIQLIVHLRKESEWTFHQIGQYLHYAVKHVQKVYYSQKEK